MRLGKYNSLLGIIFLISAFMVVPLSLGVLVLNRVENAGSQASASSVNKCDLNTDGEVNDGDLEIAATYFGRVSSDEAKKADIDGNGWINSTDLMLISRNDPVKCQTQTSINNPACTLSHSGMVRGGTVTVKSQNGLFGTIAMQYNLGTPAYQNLGNLPANGSATITVPHDAKTGEYIVRVGGFGVACTPNLSIFPNESPTPQLNACDINKDGAVTSADLGLVSSAFGKVTENSKSYDIDSNGYITAADLGIVAAYIQDPKSQAAQRCFSIPTVQN